MGLVVVCISLGISKGKVKDELYASEKKVQELEYTVDKLEVYVGQQQAAHDEAIRKANGKEIVITKKVKEVQKEYIPQVKYVYEFVRRDDEADCEAGNRLFNSFLY